MNQEKKFFPSILFGGLIGFINGFFGGGGGMIVVPVLTKYFSFNQKKAHATSIAIILPICIVSAVVYLFNKMPKWEDFAFIASGVTLGGIIGAYLLKKINNKTLEYVFECVMLIAGLKMLFFS